MGSHRRRNEPTCRDGDPRQDNYGATRADHRRYRLSARRRHHAVAQRRWQLRRADTAKAIDFDRHRGGPSGAIRSPYWRADPKGGKSLRPSVASGPRGIPRSRRKAFVCQRSEIESERLTYLTLGESPAPISLDSGGVSPNILCAQGPYHGVSQQPTISKVAFGVTCRRRRKTPNRSVT